MRLLTALLALFLVVGSPGMLHAGSQKKKSAVAIRFHAEGGSEGGHFSQEVELINGKKTYLQQMPLISEREVTAYYSFPAQDNSGTFGAYFKLDDHGRNLLAQHTMSRRNSYLIAFFNGRHVIDLYVNRPVQDGIIAIPSGLTAHDISLLEMSFPVIGQEHVKPSRKAKKQTEPKKQAEQ